MDLSIMFLKLRYSKSAPQAAEPGQPMGSDNMVFAVLGWQRVAESEQLTLTTACQQTL